jgi:hypothetical protein
MKPENKPKPIKVKDLSLADLKALLDFANKKFLSFKNPLEYIPVKPGAAHDYYMWKYTCEIAEAEILSRVLNTDIAIEAEKLAEKEVN